MNVTQPEVAIFVCTAMGRPKPSITWYRVEMDNSRTRLSGMELGVSITTGNGNTEGTRNSTLQFFPTRPSFSAIYICQATNPVSSVDINSTLIVHGK